MENQTVPGICVIYIGRTEDGSSRWVKVGRIREEKRLEGRIKEYKVADRDFWFVPRAAFEVLLPADISPDEFESKVQYKLAMRGIKRRSERFLPPDGSMELLVREVEDVIKSLGFTPQRLDVSVLRAHFERLNAEVRAELDGIVASMEPCPYQAFLKAHSTPPRGNALGRSENKDRELMTLGHILRDVAAGSGVSELRLEFGTDTLVVYPPTLSAALFQAGTEADLALPTTLRFSVRPKGISDLPEDVAMVICRNDVQDSVPEDTCLDCYQVPAPFLWEDCEALSKVRFHPEHLACLGQIGMDDEVCHYYGKGTRASMPMEVMPLVEVYPKLLPGVRFWLGLMHAQEVGIHLHSYRLPSELDWLVAALDDAAKALESIGRPVAASLRTWVKMRFVEVRAAA